MLARVAFLLLAAAAGARGACVVYEATKEDGVTPAMCDGVVDYTYYAADKSQDELEEEAVAFFWDQFGLVPQMDDACQSLVKKYVCGKFYPKCDGDEAATLPCASLCEDVVDTADGAACPAVGSVSIFTALGAAPDCDDAAEFDADEATCNPMSAAAPVQPLTQAYADLGLDTCAAVVDEFYVYAPAFDGVPPMPNPTVMAAALAAFDASVAAVLAETPVFASSACGQAAGNLVCSQSFTPFEVNDDLGDDLVLPRLPCRSFCEDALDACGELTDVPATSSFADLIPDCDAEFEEGSAMATAGVTYMYPESETVFQLTSVLSVSSACNLAADAAYEYDDEAVDAGCPAPLVLSRNADSPNHIDGSVCAIPCPYAVYGRDRTEALYKITVAVTALGSVGAGFVTATWFAFKDRRSQVMISMFGLTSFLVSVTILVMSALHEGDEEAYNDLVCEDAGTPSTSGACVAQAAILEFCVIAESAWWFAQALHMYLKVVVEKPLKKRYFHAVVWGFAALCVVIGLSAGLFGYDGASAWCFFSSSSSSLLLFYLPLGLFTLGGTFCTTMTLKKVHEVSSAAKSRTVGRESKGFLHWMGKYLRPLLFLSSVLVIFTEVLAFRLYQEAHRDTFQDSQEDYVSCLLLNYPGDAEAVCGDSAEDVPAYGFAVLSSIFLSSQSLVVFVLYGVIGFRATATLWSNFCLGRSGFVPPRQSVAVKQTQMRGVV